MDFELTHDHDELGRRQFLHKAGIVGLASPLLIGLLAETTGASVGLGGAMPVACPVPDSDHKPIPEGGTTVETLFNVLYHLRDEDRPFLEQRCKDLLGVLGVVTPGLK